jgi:hypothetical protein
MTTSDAPAAGTTPIPPALGDSWLVSYPEPRGEFLASHSNDKLAHIAMELAAELWVVKRRLAAIEQQLVSGGTIVSPDAMSTADATGTDDATGTADEARAGAVAQRDAFVSRIFAAMLPEAQ